MIAVIDKTPMSFNEFVDYPENSEHRYEMKRGVVIEMPKPRGAHSRLAGDLAFDLGMAIRQANQPFFIPKECIIKISNDTGYEPHIVVLDKTAIDCDRFGLVTKPNGPASNTMTWLTK